MSTETPTNPVSLLVLVSNSNSVATDASPFVFSSVCFVVGAQEYI